MKPHVLPLIAGKANELDKAKAVFQFIQKSIKWNNFDSHSSPDIGKALEKHTGNSGDINLALVTALNAAGISTEAVMLSTRENGVANHVYPTIDDFNYVIAKATVGGKSYFLDATEPLIGFGILPLRCFNGDGRVMSMDKPSYWEPIENGQKQATTTTLDLTLQPDGKIKGTYIEYSKGYAAFLKRQAIKKFNSTDEYIDNRDEHMAKIKITKAKIEQLDSLDMPVAETYELEFETTRNMKASTLGFNPFIFGRVSANPFKLEERNYPVNMGMPSESTSILTMHLPEGYSVAAAPKTESMALPNQGGKFVTDFQQQNNGFIFSRQTQFSKTLYFTEEYAALKEFYNKMIQSERQVLSIKKAGN
jgi:hypothetical protein